MTRRILRSLAHRTGDANSAEPSRVEARTPDQERPRRKCRIVLRVVACGLPRSSACVEAASLERFDEDDHRLPRRRVLDRSLELTSQVPTADLILRDHAD